MWIKRLLGVDPRPVPPHVFALDGERLRYAAFPRVNGSFEFSSYEEIEWPRDLFPRAALGASLRDPAAFRAGLAGLLSGVGEIAEASLVLPDAWVRVSFAETETLPRSSVAREEVLRWKLKRLIPFRVENLRLSECEVEPLLDQEDPRRVLLMFGVETFLHQLEELFSEKGIRIGFMSNESLSLVAGLETALAPLDLGLAVYTRPTGYSLVFTRRGEPAIHRYKSTGSGMSADAHRAHVLRDLRLTAKFLGERLRGLRLGRIVLAGHPEAEADWSTWLEEVFEVPPTTLSASWSFSAPNGESLDTVEVAPLFGASCRAL